MQAGKVPGLLPSTPPKSGPAGPEIPAHLEQKGPLAYGHARKKERSKPVSAYVQPHDHISYLVDAAWHYRATWHNWAGRNPHEMTRAEMDESYRQVSGCSHPDEAPRVRTLDQLGTLLAEEQRTSVAYRYPNDGPLDLPGYTESVETPYRHRYVQPFIADGYDPRAVLQALAGYEYQSCEHPGWHTSEARAICEVIRHHAISKVTATLKGSERFWTIEPAQVRQGTRI